MGTISDALLLLKQFLDFLKEVTRKGKTGVAVRKRIYDERVVMFEESNPDKWADLFDAISMPVTEHAKNWNCRYKLIIKQKLPRINKNEHFCFGLYWDGDLLIRSARRPEVIARHTVPFTTETKKALMKNETMQNAKVLRLLIEVFSVKIEVEGKLIEDIRPVVIGRGIEYCIPKDEISTGYRKVTISWEMPYAKSVVEGKEQVIKFGYGKTADCRLQIAAPPSYDICFDTLGFTEELSKKINAGSLSSVFRFSRAGETIDARFCKRSEEDLS